MKAKCLQIKILTSFSELIPFFFLVCSFSLVMTFKMYELCPYIKHMIISRNFSNTTVYYEKIYPEKSTCTHMQKDKLNCSFKFYHSLHSIVANYYAIRVRLTDTRDVLNFISILCFKLVIIF